MYSLKGKVSKLSPIRGYVQRVVRNRKVHLFALSLSLSGGPKGEKSNGNGRDIKKTYQANERKWKFIYLSNKWRSGNRPKHTHTYTYIPTNQPSTEDINQ